LLYPCIVCSHFSLHLIPLSYACLRTHSRVRRTYLVILGCSSPRVYPSRISLACRPRSWFRYLLEQRRMIIRLPLSLGYMPRCDRERPGRFVG
jgi:hypothetical protein